MMSLSLCVPLESVKRGGIKNLKARRKEVSRSRVRTERSQWFNYFNYLSSFSVPPPKKEAIKRMPVWVNLIKKNQDGGRDESLQMSVLIRGVKAAICELGRLLKWVESACCVCESFLYQQKKKEKTFSLRLKTPPSFLPPPSINSLSSVSSNRCHVWFAAALGSGSGRTRRDRRGVEKL